MTTTARLPVAALRRFTRVDPTPRCHLCATPLPERHRHLLGTEDDVACACGPCHLLFAHGGAWQAIPDRVLHDPAFALEAVDALGLPVGLVILQRDADGADLVARYPGPAGIVEGSLDPGAAARLGDSPLAGLLQPRVEALLVHRSADRVRAFLVPITTAFELVTRLRERWRGFDGGPDAAATLEDTLDELARRSTAAR